MNKIEEIKEYISLLENSSLSVLEIEKEDGTKIHLEKEHPAQQIFNASPIGAYQPTATDVPTPAPVQPQAPAAQPAAPEEDARHRARTSAARRRVSAHHAVPDRDRVALPNDKNRRRR